MRKYIFIVLSLMMTWILAGCGSNSVVDDTSSSTDTVLDVQLGSLDKNSDTFSIDVDITKNLNSLYNIELSQFNLDIDGCNVSNVVYDPASVVLLGDIGESAKLKISGNIEANCESQVYTLSMQERITKDNQTDTKVISFSNDQSSNTSPVGTTGFFNATSPLIVTQSSAEYTIKVQVIYDGYALPEQEVKFVSFSSDYGYIANPVTKTGVDGFAEFSYTAPSVLPLSGTETTVMVTTDINGTEYTQDIILHFDATSTTVNIAKLYVVPQSFMITEGGEEHNITLVTVNSENIGVSGTIVLEQPNNGTDYGEFDTTRVTTDENGIAYVHYTAPDSISGLSERNITVTETDSNLTQELNIQFGSPDEKGTDYVITVTTPDAFSVDDKGQITVKITELGDENQVISDENVYEMNLTSVFSNMLTFNDGATTYTYEKLGVNPVAVESSTISGVAIVNISALINNGDRNVTLTASVPVTIFSGPVSTISIFYVGTYEKNVGQFVNTYTIHAVDKYSNPAREGVMIYPTLVNGLKISATDTLYSSDANLSAGTPVTFVDGSVDFEASDINASEDQVIIIPNADNYNSSYLGNWNIEEVVDANTLTFKESYNSSSVNGLSYVIGNENRYIEGYGIAVADIQSTTGSFATDSSGNVQVDVVYEPVLAGHTVSIAATSYDIDENNETVRTGVSKVTGLRWGNYSSSIVKIDNDGEDHTITLSLGINNSAGTNTLEALIGVDIVPASIISSSAECTLQTGDDTATNLHTNIDGKITLQLSTTGDTDTAESCDISWNATNGDIYREY